MAPIATALREFDLWFVAYGRLETLRDESFWKSWSQSATKTGGKAESQGDLEMARSAVSFRRCPGPPRHHDSDDQRHLSADVTLFKEVRLSATLETMRSRTNDSLIVCGPARSAVHRRQGISQSLVAIGPRRRGPLDRSGRARLSRGRLVCEGDRLHEPEGSLFVEFHLAFEEPYGWFNGGNYLRSKLPVVVQDGCPPLPPPAKRGGASQPVRTVLAFSRFAMRRASLPAAPPGKPGG